MSVQHRNLENHLQCTAEFVTKALKDLFLVLIVFITAENVMYSNKAVNVRCE